MVKYRQLQARPCAYMLTNTRFLSRLMALMLALLLAACSKDNEEWSEEASEMALYESAQSAVSAGNYSEAVSRLQTLEARFPFGRYAEQAQLEIIFAYYRSRQAEAARSAADRFIRLHPNHPNVDYAYYLRGLASFEEDENFLTRIFPLDPSKRDPGAAKASFEDFSRLIERFPASEYAPDAQRRMRYLRNLLAEAELHAARYYIYRGAYIAAANRGRYVVENFQETVAVPDALAIMIEAYQLLGQNELAENTIEVLMTNYPEVGYIDKNGKFVKQESDRKGDKSWINLLTFGLFG